MKGFEALIEVTRGDRVESVHFGAVAVVDADGNLVAQTGDPDLVASLRSSAKPFQLLPLVESGGADRFGFGDKELAVMAGSHSGEPRHVETVRGILDRLGLGEDALQCGAHWPMSEASSRALREAGRELPERTRQASRVRSGGEPTPIYNNCSGKHAGMLAACVARGLDTRDYLDPQHPIQIAILYALAEMSGLKPDAIAVAIDGCSVPCFALPLRASARAFARLADPTALSEIRHSAAARIAHAMMAYPEMVGGEGRFDTDLMRATRGQVMCKGGAEGYEGIAVLSRGLGIAIKIADGNYERGTATVAVEVLHQLGALDDAALDALRAYHRRAVKNHRGLEVGEVRPVFKLRSLNSSSGIGRNSGNS